MRQCKHPTCGGVCRRAKKEKKRYKIQPYSKKRRETNKIYNEEARAYKKGHAKCETASPVCTGKTQGVHHTRGRGKYLLDKETWEAACNACNDYVEAHPQWAIENGHKKSRLTI